jgi:hypothetical protein
MISASYTTPATTASDSGALFTISVSNTEGNDVKHQTCNAVDVLYLGECSPDNLCESSRALTCRIFAYFALLRHVFTACRFLPAGVRAEIRPGTSAFTIGAWESTFDPSGMKPVDCRQA